MSETDKPQSLSFDGRRRFLAAGAAVGALALESTTNNQAHAQGRADATAEVVGSEHWTSKQADGKDIRLFIWRKQLRNPAAAPRRGTILFVHGSTMAGTPVFDLHVPGKPEMNAMDHFARLGYDTWCLDHEGYGRSDKSRDVNCDISNGADDLAAVSAYVIKATGDPKLLVYGVSSGALRAALFTERHPDRVRKLVLDALVWTGEGSPTLANRAKSVDRWRSSNRRAIDYAMVESIFTRDHPGTADPVVVKAYADAILALDTSVPTGTYLDMTTKLPVNDPTKIPVPTMIMRGQFDGIAGFQDVVNFFAKLPNPDKRFVVMQGIAHSGMHEKNFAIVLNTIETFYGEPAPVYTI
jgi:pimeloyl-ACP methyl ester carboxylesterase